MAMRCRACNSTDTRVTCTERRDRYQKRWLKCRACGHGFATHERYEKPKPGPLPGTKPRIRPAHSHASRLGENNANSVLTRENIYELRRAYDQGTTWSDIKQKFGIASSTFYRIGTRQSWRHLPEKLP